MRRMTIAFALSAMMVAGSALAQIPPPKPTPTPTPAGQAAPPPAGQKPVTPPAVPAKPPEPFPTDARVGFIDLQRVVAESKLGKQGQDAMKKLNDKLTADLTVKQKDMQALQDRIKTQQNVVAEAVLQGMVRELEKMQREAQFTQQDAQVQIDQLNQQLMSGFQEKVLPVVEDLRKEKNLWIIFALGENSNIAAANAGLDLTLEVVKRLDATIK